MEVVIDNLMKRKIKITDRENMKELKTVVHLQYLSWPDHGAPEEADNEIFEKIIDYMREANQQSKGNNNQNKITLHCSAGIGRTGTLIAIYNIQLAVETMINNKEALIKNGHYKKMTN
mmetsp:Transcript_28013/g.27039  ORF Transcript_28013/g.27039 Transcript_28013/m.27039 type:complete len:118 (+) Transcript_28013:853-1206(+)